jgi:biotin carboxylase
MKWICLIGGSGEQGVRAVKECGFEAGIIADYKALSNSFLQMAYAIVPAQIDKVNDVRRALDNLIQFMGKPVAIVSFTELGLLPAAQLSTEYGLPTNPVEVVLCTRDKSLMRKKLESEPDLYLPFIEGDVEKVYRNVRDRLQEGSWIIKPNRGFGSQSLQFVNDKLALKRWRQEQQHSNFSWIAEPYVSGPEFSVEAVTSQGKHIILGVTQKETTGIPNFIEVGHVFPANISSDSQIAIESIVERLLSVLGVQMGASHTEVKIDPKRGPVVIETHTRVGGDCIPELVQYTLGSDQYSLAIQSILGQNLKLHNSFSSPHKAAAIKFFQANEGCLSGINYQEIPELSSIIRWHFDVEIGQQVPRIVDSYSRLGYVICCGNNSEEARQNARAITQAFDIQVQTQMNKSIAEVR